MRTIIQKEKFTEIMNRLCSFYNWLARLRFGFFTGLMVGVFSYAFFVNSFYLYGLTAAQSVFETTRLESWFVLVVFLVCFVGEAFRYFMARRSCTVDGVPE
jgi:hypothetical protein